LVISRLVDRLVCWRAPPVPPILGHNREQDSPACPPPPPATWFYRRAPATSCSAGAAAMSHEVGRSFAWPGTAPTKHPGGAAWRVWMAALWRWSRPRGCRRNRGG